MLGLRRLCAAWAVAIAFYPFHEHLAGAHRADDLDVDHPEQGTPGGSMAVVAKPNQLAALVETQFIDPVSLTVMSGIAAAGSVVSIGKTIADARARSKQNAQIATAIQDYQAQTTAGCKMLDTAAAFLVTKMNDLDEIYKGKADLEQACRNAGSGETKTYTALLKTRLEDTCYRVSVYQAFRTKCLEAFTTDFEAKVTEACGMAQKWGTEAALESSKKEVWKHIWQMDGLKRGTCGRGLEGIAESSSYIERSQVKTRVPLLDVLGLAFTLCGFADMLVAVGDHAISKVWGDGVQGLLAFTEHRAQQAQKAVCDTFTAIWLKSFVPGNAAKLAALGLRMTRLGVPQEVAVERMKALSRLIGEDHTPEDWGVDKETMYLCDHRKYCMTPMGKAWSEDAEGEANPKVGGTKHPSAGCFGPTDSNDMKLMPICCGADQDCTEGDVINAVPQECFRAFAVMQSDKRNLVPINRNYGIMGSGRAFEFWPDEYQTYGKKVHKDDTYWDIEKCVKPLETLWNGELAVSTFNLEKVCPS